MVKKCSVIGILLLLCSFFVMADPVSYKFDFGSGKTAEGYIKADDKANWPSRLEGTTFGFLSEKDLVSMNAGKDPLTGDFITSDQPFYFSVKVPEGNYRVTVFLGDPSGISNTTVKAESRRLMVYNFSTKIGVLATKSFVVSVRSARIGENDSIRLKSREFGFRNWDDQITLEFGGERPCIAGLEIEKVESVPVIFLTGNSTVVDQEKEPWASWGQMFPLFLNDQIVVANYAESGETLKAFIRENRLQKIATQIKPGDYLFMEFAHNDQKPGGNHVEPYTSYQEYLLKFVNLARENGATPVLVTSVLRRRFDEHGKIINTLEEYPDAMRTLAEKENIALIDLNTMSKTFYEALGPELSKKAFVHYPANSFPGQTKALADDSHFSTYGAYELAKCVVQAVLESDLDLKAKIEGGFLRFNPAIPDSYNNWKWPMSPAFSSQKPAGN